MTATDGTGAPVETSWTYVRLQDRLTLLARAVQQTATELDAMWSETLDHGELMTRVVEASHALHRAVLALEGDGTIGSRR
jgi:hypothetical protein